MVLQMDRLLEKRKTQLKIGSELFNNYLKENLNVQSSLVSFFPSLLRFRMFNIQLQPIRPDK